MFDFKPKNPDYEQATIKVFAGQTVMTTIGARLMQIQPGRVDIALPFNQKLTQQNDFVHAGIITTIVDSACGAAAYTLMPAGYGVLTVEYKMNLLSPAVGEEFMATGRVLRAGSTITTTEGRVEALQKDGIKLIAVMLATMMRVELRD